MKTAVEFFVNWDVDEIIILDIDATKQGRCIQLDVIKQASRECFVPLTVGGGIRSINDIKNVLRAGADKISINSQKNLINSNVIQEDIDCNKLIELIGGQQQTELLWLGNLDGKKNQFARSA